jgi:hypothetical protein
MLHFTDRSVFKHEFFRRENDVHGARTLACSRHFSFFELRWKLVRICE